MPKEKFRNYSAEYRKQAKNKKFSFDTIYALSESFQVSVPATLIRFGEVGTHEIFAVISKDNIAEWFVKSADFPNWKFKFKRGDVVPLTTVAGEYFTMKNRKFTGIEEVSAYDWFIPSKDDSRADKQMFEQCYYSDSYGYVISLIWF